MKIEIIGADEATRNEVAAHIEAKTGIKPDVETDKQAATGACSICGENHSRAAIVLAEIIIPHGIDRKGNKSRISTAYGMKTRCGIAALIDGETRQFEVLAAFKSAVERMEAVADGILIARRNKGVSPKTHVTHMAGHLAQHAKIARAAIALAEGRAE